MGLYVQTYAQKPKKNSLFGLRKSSLSNDIVREAQKWAVEKGIGDLFHIYEVGPTLSHFTFYPLNESLRFEVDDRNVSIGVKTSSVGAGYHAAFIELCDYLEKNLDLKWNWQLSGEECGDETGYAKSKDFNNLQAQHFEQAVAILNHVLSSESPTGFCLHIDPILMHEHDKIAGPRGYIEPILFSDYQDGDPYEIKAITDKLFTWQDKNINEKFWVETLEALLWHEFPWRAAMNSYEEYIEKAIESCLRQIETNSLPHELLRAVEEYNLHSNEVVVPNPQGVGYRKRNLYTDITGPWRCSIPGYFYHTMEDDNSTCNFAFDNIIYRGSSINIEVKDGGNLSVWLDHLSNSPEVSKHNFSYRLPVELDDEGDGWHYGMGMGVTPVLENKQYLVMFSVTAKSKKDVFYELERQFENGIHFKGGK